MVSKACLSLGVYYARNYGDWRKVVINYYLCLSARREGYFVQVCDMECLYIFAIMFSVVSDREVVFWVPGMVEWLPRALLVYDNN